MNCSEVPKHLQDYTKSFLNDCRHSVLTALTLDPFHLLLYLQELAERAPEKPNRQPRRDDPGLLAEYMKSGIFCTDLYARTLFGLLQANVIK